MIIARGFWLARACFVFIWAQFSFLILKQIFFSRGPHSFAQFFFGCMRPGFVIKFMKRKQNQNYNKIRLQPLKRNNGVSTFA